MSNALFATFIVAMLTACGSSQEEREPMPVKDTVVGDMVGTMDKARGVEDTVMQQKQELDRQLQESEGAQ